MEEDVIRSLKANPGYYYLASPYSKYPIEMGGLEGAFQEICRASAWLLKQGVRVFSPIAHSHPIAYHGGIDPADHDLWLHADKPLMDGACGLIVAMMPTWTESYGIGVEIQQFHRDGKPIHYLAWPSAAHIQWED